MGGAVVVASGVGWFTWHEHAAGGQSHAAAAKVATPAAVGDPAQPPAHEDKKPIVAHRLDAGQRERLLGAVRQAHGRRAAEPRAGMTAEPTREPGEDLDKEYVREAVHAILPLVTECYDSALARDPRLGGKLVVSFTIEGEPDVGGLVTESAIQDDGSDIQDASFRECVQETMFALSIDPPVGGGPVQVIYPFTFHHE